MANRVDKKRALREGVVARSPTPGTEGVGMIFGFPWRELGIPLLLAVATFLLYWPSLSSGLVYDSGKIIFDEGFVTSAAHLPEVLSLKVLNSYLMLCDRPGQMLYLMLLAMVWGHEPFGYHLGSNLLHAANVALLWIFMRRLLAEEGREGVRVRAILTVCVLLFACHPLAVETVANISYSSDLLVTFFTLVALLAAMVFRPERGWGNWCAGGLAVFCALASVMCKESGLATALLLTVYWFLFRRGENRGPWLGFLGAALAVTAVFLAARFYFVPVALRHLNYLGGSLPQVFLIQPQLWVFMMGKVAWPTGLSADYTLENAGGIPQAFAMIILVVVLAGQGWLATRSRVGAMGVAIFWLGLVTVSNFMPLNRVVADRFYYLPLTGLALQVLALYLLVPGGSKLFRTLLIAGGLAIVPLTELTLARQAVFADDYSLWTDTLKVSPRSYTGHNNLAIALTKKGEMERAMEEFQKALAIIPEYDDAHFNLGLTLAKSGKVDAAMVEYRSAIRFNPDYAKARYNLGLALLEKKLAGDAADELARAVALNPDDADARYNLGLALVQLGRSEAAEVEFRKVLELKPHQADAAYQLGLLLAEKEQWNEARACFEKALQIDPDWAKVYANLASVLARQGHVDEAIVQYKKSLELRPDDAWAETGWGTLCLQRGDLDGAMGHFQLALKIDPTDATAHNNLGIALYQKGRLVEAVRQFREALRLKPDYRDAGDNLAETEEALRKRAGAH